MNTDVVPRVLVRVGIPRSSNEYYNELREKGKRSLVPCLTHPVSGNFDFCPRNPVQRPGPSTSFRPCRVLCQSPSSPPVPNPCTISLRFAPRVQSAANPFLVNVVPRLPLPKPLSGPDRPSRVPTGPVGPQESLRETGGFTRGD